MVSTLKKRKYEVTELDGTEASIEPSPVRYASSPGVVIFSTHGNKLGQLLTAQQAHRGRRREHEGGLCAVREQLAS